ncbi:nucleoside deaminase [Streptacidiphilus sp. 4-A2]|nr:nucleoside deaminase [Streptacidiphilus sp. 4-A2]
MTGSAADIAHLHTAVAAAARRSRERGNHPFGAVLVGPEGSVLLEAENTVTTERDATGHAETNLIRLATPRFDGEYLGTCTFYTSTEPCAMCAGAIYWAAVGRVVFALGEEELLAMTGADPANPTLDLPCRTVFAAGRREVAVVGPLPADGAREVHAGFWHTQP